MKKSKALRTYNILELDEAADLLDECETLIVAMRQEIQNLGGSLEGVIAADATLAKLRAAQDKADE